MSEQWISTKKKYCEICKTWIADNRVSVEKHESSMKHKGMIQHRLREMSKRTKEKEVEEGHLNATLIAMEQAALAAMKRDGHATRTASSRFSTPTVGLMGQSASMDPKIAQQHAVIQQDIDERKRKLQEQKEKSKKFQRTVLPEDSIFKKRKYEHEDEFRKQVASSSKRSWDVRKLVASDVVKAEPNAPKNEPGQNIESTRQNSESSQNAVKIEPGQNVGYARRESEPVRHIGGLGPWIPVVKQAPTAIELQEFDQEPKVIYDDLPEQAGASKCDPLFDEDEIDTEIEFKEKVLPIVSSSKKSKPVFFRKTKGSKNAKVKEDN